MARLNANNNANASGRLVDHPQFTTLSNGDVSAWFRVACERSEIDPATKQPKIDVLPFQMYISKERIGKMPMYWAFKGSQVKLTYATRSFMKTTPEGNRSELTLEVDDIVVDDSKAETDARLQRYANEGDQVATAALAARASNRAALPTSVPAQGQPIQSQVQPAQAPANTVTADVPWMNQGDNTVAPEWANS